MKKELIALSEIRNILLWRLDGMTRARALEEIEEILDDYFVEGTKISESPPCPLCGRYAGHTCGKIERMEV